MILTLQQLPQLTGPQGDGYGGKVPKRALYMHPDAAAALLELERFTGGLVYTDILRSAAAIRNAVRNKPGITQPVGYSFHGFGGCVDIDVDASKKRRGIGYSDIMSVLARFGFHCHRRDGAAGEGKSESWHFNYLGTGTFAQHLLAATTDDHATWSRPAEAMIQAWYGPALQLTDEQIATLLPVAHATDDKDFQRQWDLVVDGIAGPRTQRVLAFVTATMNIIPLPNV